MAEMWTWTSAGDDKVCPDCAARHGQTLTEAEWQGLGLPGEGATFCGGRCFCLIIREDVLERITGTTGQAALRALGIDNPLMRMGGYEQRILTEAGRADLADLSIDDARAALIADLQAADPELVHLETKALHELVGLYDSFINI